MYLFTGGYARNTEYNIRRKYEFYAIIPPSQRSKKGTAIAIRKELSYKSDNARGLPTRNRKKNYRLNLPPPTYHLREEVRSDLLNQLPPTIIVMGGFSAPYGEAKKQAQERKC